MREEQNLWRRGRQVMARLQPCLMGLLLLLTMSLAGPAAAQQADSGDLDLDSLLADDPAPAEKENAPAQQKVPALQAAEATSAPATVGTIPVESLPAEPAEETAQSEIAKRRQLEEITVTATKRTIDIRDVPLSITAFDGDDLRAIGATNLESMARFTPGVAVSPGLDPEAAQVIIRGVATDTFSPSSPAPSVCSTRTCRWSIPPSSARSPTSTPST